MPDPSSEARDAVVALLDRAIAAEARADAPPERDRADWLFGSTGFTEPDQHCWMAAARPEMWVPRALCFWHAALWSGASINARLMVDPVHSLKRWPEIEDAVGDYLADAPWLLD